MTENATTNDTLNATTPPDNRASITRTTYQIIKDDTYQLADDTLTTRLPADGSPLYSGSGDFLPRPDVFVAPLSTPVKSDAAKPTANTVTFTETDTVGVLTKTPKGEALTDSYILQQSEQLNAPSEMLEDDHSLAGRNIEHLGVATKQWLLTLHWQRTSVDKTGLINKLRSVKQPLDLDLTCLLCNRYGEVSERVWFKNVRDRAESVRHVGDELLGVHSPEELAKLNTADAPPNYAKPTHQERISVWFNKIPPTIFHVVMLVSCHTGHALSSPAVGYCELADDEGNTILHLDLSTLDDCPALWLATLTRVGDTWRFNADLQPLGQHSMSDMCRIVAENLSRTAK